MDHRLRTDPAGLGAPPLVIALVIDQPNQGLKFDHNGVESPLSFAADEGFTIDPFDRHFQPPGASEKSGRRLKQTAPASAEKMTGTSRS